MKQNNTIQKRNRGALPMGKLTLPIAMEQFFRILVYSVDTMMLSSYSNDAVAAVGLVSQYAFFLNILFSVIGTGCSIVLAQYLGAEKSEKEQKCKGDCHGHCSHEMVKLTKPIDDAPEIDENAEEYPLAVQCPCCDEVLYPQFLSVCKRCGHEFEDGIDEESIPDAHFYVPGEYDSKKDEDDDEDDEQSGAAGCCVMLFALTAMNLLWKFFC